MALKLITDLERFSSYVEYNEETGCWLWIGRLDKDGYGSQMKIGSRVDNSRKVVRPHRWMYEHFVDQIPEGLVLDHECRVRNCVNPWHLEPVTAVVNTKRGARANATHCKSGHPLSGDNLYIGNSLKRACRTCRNRWARDFGLKTGWAAQKRFKERIKSVSVTK